MDTAVAFPLEGLDMAPYLTQPGAPPLLYDLSAVRVNTIQCSCTIATSNTINLASSAHLKS